MSSFLGEEVSAVFFRCSYFPSCASYYVLPVLLYYSHFSMAECIIGVFKAIIVCAS